MPRPQKQVLLATDPSPSLARLGCLQRGDDQEGAEGETGLVAVWVVASGFLLVGFQWAGTGFSGSQC